ncbi:Adenylate cyclase type 10, partial [Blyttiomyces sp. JEL0837]
MTAGCMSRVIMGIPSERLDYSIYGSQLSILGNILNNTLPGQLGVDEETWSVIFPFGGSENVEKSIGNYVQCSKHTGDVLLRYFLDELKMDFADYMHNTNRKLSTLQEKTYTSRLATFVNLAIWTALKRREMQLQRRRSTISNFDRRASKPRTSVVSFQDRVRPSITNMGSDESIDLSSETEILTGEFRKVTIVFVKLRFDFDKRLSQLAMTGFLQCLRKYEGVFQQFSVDDKGQTLLAVFGLPPHSHPNESEYAVKAMVEFVDFANVQLGGKVSIGLATGEILFTTIGTDNRREASLL